MQNIKMLFISYNELYNFTDNDVSLLKYPIIELKTRSNLD